jgi:hypothetical protein
MSSIRKFWKKGQNAAESGGVSARTAACVTALQTVLYVTHFLIRVMLS